MMIDSDADSVSTNVPTNVTSAVLKKFHNKKVTFKMDCHILHTILLGIILLLIIAIICYHYAKHRLELKNVLPC